MLQNIESAEMTWVLVLNDTMHFTNLKALDDVVKKCKIEMQVFSTLEMPHPLEWTIVSKNLELKQFFLESFMDDV